MTTARFSTHLGGGQAHAVGLVHGVGHVVQQHPQAVVELGHLPGMLAQYLILAHFNDFSNCHVILRDEIDYLRRQKRQNTVSLETEDEDGESTAYDIPDETWSPEVIAERAADAEAVRAAMAELTPDLREILTMREIGGLSYEELADALGLELGTVRSRLNRARKKLCAILTESGNFSEAAPSKNGKGGVRHG